MAEEQPTTEQAGNAAEELPERYSLVAGGGFHALLGRYGLLEDDQLPSYKAAVGLALLAWSIPAVFVVWQSLIENNYSGWDYFEDPTVYSRYLVAILIMVSTERMADSRVALLIQQFGDAQILDGPNRARFAAGVVRADKRASSRVAELVILAFAFFWSVATTRLATVISADSWEGVLAGNAETVLSWAGEASAFTSNTLFIFLVLRWFWRFFIWASLLRTTSRLKLQIMPLHPDRCGGLGFLGIFPGIFSGLIFALSCVIAASFYKAIPSFGDSSQLLWLAVTVWLVLVSSVFLGPLLFFLRPLYLARERSLLDYGRLAHGHHLEFHRKWIERKTPGHEILGSADPSSLSDLNASVQTVHEMRTIPIDRPALVQLLVSAGVPLLVVAALQMPVGDLLKLIMGVLF
jgi:hypothetical protein